MKKTTGETFPQIEEKVLAFWKDEGIFEKSLELRKDSPRYSFYDGPPFATGLPHYGHILAMAIKDVVTRYKTMQGFYVPRKNGWDCHGLPVEYELEKELGLKGKADIEKLGVDVFNQKARGIVMRYSSEWVKTIERMGRWIDTENAYKTMDNDYIESVWWVFKQIWDKGYVYKDYRVSPYCPRCGTTLSNFEVTQGYKDVKDESVFVKFPISNRTQLVSNKLVSSKNQGEAGDDSSSAQLVSSKLVSGKSQGENTEGSFSTGSKSIGVAGESGSRNEFGMTEEKSNTYFLVWTTTPWTLPSNVALVVGAGIEYVKIKVRSADLDPSQAQDDPPSLGLRPGKQERIQDDPPSLKLRQGKQEKEEFLILAKDRLSVIMGEYDIVEEMKGADLVGMEYESLYSMASADHHYKVYGADFVTTTDGSGIVHIAPAFGEDDMRVAKEQSLPNDVRMVDLEGKLLTGFGLPGEGKKVKEADHFIKADLEERGLLYKKEKITHSYPFCWRCDTALLYYALPSWYVKVTAVQEDLIKNNQEIHWVPNHLKDGRFGKWLEGVKDWAISRSRYWGAPLPVWECVGMARSPMSDCIRLEDDKRGSRESGEDDQQNDQTNDQMPMTNDQKNGQMPMTNDQSNDQQMGCGHVKVVGSVEELAQLAVDKADIQNMDLHKPQIDNILIKCEKCGGVMKRTSEVFDCWFESGSMPYAQWHYPFENKEEFMAGAPADFIAEGLDQTRGWFYTLHVLSTMVTGKPAFKNVVVNGLILAKDGKKLSKSLRNYTPPQELFDTVGVDALRYFLMVSTPIGEDYRFSDDAVREMVRKLLIPLWNSYKYLATFAELEGWKPGENSELTAMDRWMLAKLNLAISDVDKWMGKYELTKAARVLTDLVTDLSTWYIRRSKKRTDKAFFATLYKVLKEMSKLIAPFTPFIAEELYQNMKEAGEMESVHLCDYPVSGEIDKTILDQMEKIRALVEIGHSLRAENGLKVRQPLGEMSIKIDGEMPEELIEILLDELNVKKFSGDFDGFVKTQTVKVGESKGLKVALETELNDELKEEGYYREIVRHIQDLRKVAGYKAGEAAIVGFVSQSDKITELLNKKSEEFLADTTTKIKEGGLDQNDAKKSVKIDESLLELEINKLVS